MKKIWLAQGNICSELWRNGTAGLFPLRQEDLLLTYPLAVIDCRSLGRSQEASVTSQVFPIEVVPVSPDGSMEGEQMWAVSSWCRHWVPSPSKADLGSLLTAWTTKSNLWYILIFSSFLFPPFPFFSLHFPIKLILFCVNVS